MNAGDGLLQRRDGKPERVPYNSRVTPVEEVECSPSRWSSP